MQGVPPSLLKAQVSPHLHSLYPPLWSPVLHVQVGLIGAGNNSYSDIVGWGKCSSTAACARGAFLVALHAPRSLVKTHVPAAVLWLLSSHGPAHPSWETSCPSLRVPLMQSITAVPFPVTHCTYFSGRKKASSRETTKATEVSNQSAQNILSFLGEMCSLY